LCGYCSNTAEFNLYKDNGATFNLTSMDIGASGNGSDEFDFTFTGHLAGGGIVTQIVNGLAPTAVTAVNFNSSWQNLASVNVVVDNTGNSGISASSFDDIVVSQATTITYANVAVTDGAGMNTDPKPVALKRLMVNGVLYDVTIIWGGSYDAAYSTGGPIFEAVDLPFPSAESTVAVNAILDALIEDGYTPLPPLNNGDYGAFVLVPGTAAFGTHWGNSVELDQNPLILKPSPLLAYSTSSPVDYIGWTRFAPAATSVTIDVDGWVNHPNSYHPAHNRELHASHNGSGSSRNDPVEVTIYGAPNFDANLVDGTTLRFGPGNAPKTSTALSIQEETGDSYVDATAEFLMSDVAIDPACTDTELTVTGESLSGTPFTGTDANIECRTMAPCH